MATSLLMLPVGWLGPRDYSHVTITHSFAVWSPLCGPVAIAPSLVVHADGVVPPFPVLQKLLSAFSNMVALPH